MAKIYLIQTKSKLSFTKILLTGEGRQERPRKFGVSLQPSYLKGRNRRRSRQELQYRHQKFLSGQWRSLTTTRPPRTHGYPRSVRRRHRKRRAIWTIHTLSWISCMSRTAGSRVSASRYQSASFPYPFLGQRV